MKSITDTAFDVIIVNFANADMVGHSGKMEPTVKAVEAVDAQLGRIYQAVKQRGGELDHHGGPRQCGDADRPGDGRPAYGAYDQPGAVHPGHGRRPNGRSVCGRAGSLRDISPTMLGLMEMDLPKEMTGGDLRLHPLVGRKGSGSRLRNLQVAAAFEGAGHGDLVGVLDVGAGGDAGGDAGDAEVWGDDGGASSAR